jgi:hypothetical protein
VTGRESDEETHAVAPWVTVAILSSVRALRLRALASSLRKRLGVSRPAWHLRVTVTRNWVVCR